jgi:hypothetical protein
MSPNRGIRRVVLAILALIASVTAGIVPASQSSALSCSSLLVIGARGSGEPYEPAVAGMGRTNYPAYEAIRAKVPDAQAYGLPYDAVAANTYSLPQQYWTSVDFGGRFLLSILEKQAKNCPNQRFVLIGFSQGAHVVGDNLQYLEGTSVASKVAAVLFFGDPRFNPSATINMGNYNRSLKGIASELGAVPVRNLSSTWNGKVRSYCYAQDFICNASAANFALCNPIIPRDCGHFAYVSRGAANEGGSWAGDLARQALMPTTLPRTGTAPAPSANAYHYTVYHTGGVGLKMRAGPGTGYAHLGTVPEGGTVAIVCQAHGQRVLPGSDIWNRLSNGKWVYDWYTNTPNTGRFSPPIPQC